MDLKRNDHRKSAVKKGKSSSAARKNWQKVLKVLLVCLITVSCILGGILSGMMVGYIKTASPITPEQLKLDNLNTFVYDANGAVIGELSQNENREWVSYDNVPQSLKDAFVSIEDERFFNHEGVDVQGLARAFFYKLTHPTKQMPGGSTITMQVIKNITGEGQRSLQRKIQEQWRAMQLEKKLTKWEILQLYMNVITTGPNIYGVQSAAKTYFNKDVSQLTIAESASIAGITNNPAKYNPFTTKGRENTKSRQVDVLNKMKELGKITPEQYEQAINEPLKFFEGTTTETKKLSKQSYFVDQVVLDVKKDLMSQGMAENMALNLIYNGGLRIHTTMDVNVQNAMDEVFKDSNNFPVANPGNPHPQAAMVIVDPANGQVKAMYGGYGDKTSNTLNRATQIQRQPGSSIKPIAVYGPALNERLITAATIIDDSPTYMLGVENGLYQQNFDLSYKGLTTVRDALRQSLNVVAAKIYRDYLGPDRSLQYLKKVGINRDQKEISLALGGLTEGVSPLQMAAAYVPFANRGMYYQPTTYTKVEDQDGKVLLEKKAVKPAMVYDESAAYIMNSMLQEVCTAGTAQGYGNITNANGEVILTGGKTGTTSENIDKWFVGFSPYYVGAAWYGYDKTAEIPGLEQSQALNLWNKVMMKIHSSLPPKDFKEPSDVVKKDICYRSGKVYTELCKEDPLNAAQGIGWAPIRNELFVKGTEPKDDDKCNVHVAQKVCTESTDAFGRSLLAGPNCPASSVITKVFIHRTQPYAPAGPDAPYPDDFYYDYSDGEYCNVHTEKPKESLAEKVGNIINNIIH